MKKILVVALVVAIALIGVTAAFANDHMNISCRVCHTPHHGSAAVAPLWDTNAEAIRTAASTTGLVGASAKSLICTVCHDGSQWITETGRTDVWATGQAGNHPISTTADLSGRGLSASITDTNTNIQYFAGEIECQSCHFVHKDGRSTTKYVRTYAGSAPSFCQTCHNASW